MNLPSHPPSHAAGGADVSPGQLLRELHGASLGGDGQTMEPAMRLALEAGIGGLGHWAAQFGAGIQAMGGGSGWALLVFDPRTGTLRNQWVGDATEAFAAGTPLLALDLHEPVRRANPGALSTHVDTCLATIDWAGVHAHYRAAVFAASEALGADPADVANGLVLDVRRAGVYESATTRLPQTIWRDPAAVARRPAARPPCHRLLRPRPRGEPRHCAAPACGRGGRALPARRHRWLEPRRAPAGAAGGAVLRHGASLPH